MFSAWGSAMNKGRRLKLGDTIGLVAPASPATEKEFEQAVKGLEKEGFNVVPGQSCTESYGGYLSGKPIIRVDDIHKMFSSESIDGIMCLSGSYRSSNLFPFFVIDLIKLILTV